MTSGDLFLAVLSALIAKDIIYAVFQMFINGVQEVWKVFSK
jgi:hypothetical protein